MAFTLSIETGNAAFADDRGAELARIIRGVSRVVLAPAAIGGVLRDYNGNIVGRWELTKDPLEWECPRCHTINAEEDTEPGEMTCVDCHHTVQSDEVTV